MSSKNESHCSTADEYAPDTRSSPFSGGADSSARQNDALVASLRKIQGKLTRLQPRSGQQALLNIQGCDKVIELRIQHRWVLSVGDDVVVAAYPEMTGKLIALAYRNQTQGVAGWNEVSPDTVDPEPVRVTRRPELPPLIPQRRKRQVGLVIALIGVLMMVSWDHSGTGLLMLICGIGATFLRWTRDRSQTDFARHVASESERITQSIQNQRDHFRRIRQQQHKLFLVARRMVESAS